MTCILYVLLCGELMVGVFPSAPLDLSAWILISGVVLLPCALLRSLRHVAWLSFWCTVAHMIVNGVIILYCFTTPAHFSPLIPKDCSVDRVPFLSPNQQLREHRRDSRDIFSGDFRH